MKGLYMDRIPVQLVVDYKMSVALILSFIYWTTTDITEKEVQDLMCWTPLQVTTVVAELINNDLLNSAQSESVPVLHLTTKAHLFFSNAQLQRDIEDKMKIITPSATNFRSSRPVFIEGAHGIKDKDIQVQYDVEVWYKSGQKEIPTELLERVQLISKDYIKRFCTNKIKERLASAMPL